MYYEEQVILGVLCYRTSPDGSWQQCSRNQLTTRLLTAERRVAELEEQIKDDEESRAGDAWDRDTRD